MDNGAVYHYIDNYFRQCLGVGEILLPMESSQVVLDENPPGSIQHHLLWEKGALEGVVPQGGETKLFVLFVRIPWNASILRESNDATKKSEALTPFPSLDEDLKSLELFIKLRQAMKLDKISAPYVEILDNDIKGALIDLQSLATHIFIMQGDGSEEISSLWSNVNAVVDSSVQSSKAGTFWILPDPAELFNKPQLKRPTWDLLRQWMDEYL